MKLNKKAVVGALALAMGVGVFTNPQIVKAEQEEEVVIDMQDLTIEVAKSEAIAELQAAGVTSDFFLNQIRSAKTIEGVNALKDELLKSHADSVAGEDNKEKPAEDKKAEDDTAKKDLDNAKEKAIKELKDAGITSDLFLNKIKSANTIEGVESLKAELLKSHKDSKKEDKKTIPATKIEDIAKKNEKEKETEKKENNEVGYSTKEKAEAAAKEALKKDEINKSYTISEKDGKFFYVLSPNEKVEIKTEENKKEESAKVDEKATEKTFDFDKGFDKKEDAIKQAEALIKNSKINNGYNITKGTDGKYYIQLTTDGKKTEGADRKEIKESEIQKALGNKATAKKVNNNNNKTSGGNVQTGVAGISGVAAILASAAAAYKATKKENK